MKIKKQKWYEHMQWEHIFLEAFCHYNISRNKTMEVCDWEDCKKELEDESHKIKWERMKNCCYIDAKLPKKCPKHVCYKCFELDCPFLGYSNACDDDIIVFENAFGSRLIRIIAKVRHLYKTKVRGLGLVNLEEDDLK